MQRDVSCKWAILPPLDFILVFEHLWMATVRNWVGLVFGHLLFFFLVGSAHVLCED